MAADDTVGYDSQEQKDEQLEALKIEHLSAVAQGRTDRAKEVAAYAKKYHGASLVERKAAAAD